MRIDIMISRVESRFGAFGSSYLKVYGDGVKFRVPDTAKNRAAYRIGRVVDIDISPRKR